MERRALGRSGVVVPAVGMGTWRTFDTTDDRRPLVEAALAAGIDLFDSSPMYGRAESALSAAVANVRSQLLVATKMWTPDPEAGREQVARALKFFGHVDVYQVHNLVNVPDHLAHLEELKAAGLVRAIGVTHYQEMAFPEIAHWMSSGRIDMIQIPYNPLRREAEQELLPLADSLGLGVLVMSPLQGGILNRRPSPDEMLRLGVETWAQAILKWIASDRRVSSVLTATHRRHRVLENAKAGEPPFFTPEQRDLVLRIAEGS